MWRELLTLTPRVVLAQIRMRSQSQHSGTRWTRSYSASLRRPNFETKSDRHAVDHGTGWRPGLRSIKIEKEGHGAIG
jgi:hypothetical protein